MLKIKVLRFLPISRTTMTTSEIKAQRQNSIFSFVFLSIERTLDYHGGDRHFNTKKEKTKSTSSKRTHSSPRRLPWERGFTARAFACSTRTRWPQTVLKIEKKIFFFDQLESKRSSYRPFMSDLEFKREKDKSEQNRWISGDPFSFHFTSNGWFSIFAIFIQYKCKSRWIARIDENSFVELRPGKEISVLGLSKRFLLEMRRRSTERSLMNSQRKIKRVSRWST